MANGCCYCFVESGGERTFIVDHGAEYLFQPEWFDLLDPADYSCVYVCGLEVEEPTGVNLISWLEKNPGLPICYAPGPRAAGCLRKKRPALWPSSPCSTSMSRKP